MGHSVRGKKDLRTNEWKNDELEMRMKDDVPDKEIEPIEEQTKASFLIRNNPGLAMLFVTKPMGECE